ncbi:polysaccharide lyase 8 family protein [Sphingobacterium spiritivorum]|uniref:polysaccharide lyase 8 family protein n=1 Tax=Sphingobacterium spiritivorum TaxID=258 RepID=UPI003DA29117
MKYLQIIMCFLVLILTKSVSAQATYPFGTISKRIVDDHLRTDAGADKRAEDMLARMSKNGSWEDIDYADVVFTKWTPSDHLTRLSLLIQSYINKDGKHYNDPKFYNAIVQAYQFWYDKDPKSGNWWHNEISVPQQLGVLLILSRYGAEKLPADLDQKLIERMKRGDAAAKTGANKTDIAMHYFYRSLLTEDKELLSYSLSELYQPVQLVDGEEGLQYDYSYLQHGPQLYISGYGNVYLTGLFTILKYVYNTPYFIAEDKLALLTGFYRHTFLNMHRGKYMDFNVEGRGVSRKDILLKTNEAKRLDIAMLIDSKNIKTYESERAKFENPSNLSKEVKPVHRYFWKADFTLHNRPEYHVSVRTASDRTNRSEAGNGENLYGRYLSDGAMNIQQSGPEYMNIMPVWEWDKIPGTTSPDHKEDKLMDTEWGVRGNNQFAGGVSDSLYGVTAYQMNYDAVQAKKSWFFLDQEILCLGADINSDLDVPVTTTINQAWLQGPVQLDGKTTVKKQAPAQVSASQLWHNGSGYVIAEGQRTFLSAETQEGSWKRINKSGEAAPVKGDVFKLWIDHGIRPKDAHYEYRVLPALTNAKAFAKIKNPAQVIENTKRAQIVYYSGSQLLMGVMYEAGKIEHEGLIFTTDKPCVFMLRKTGNQVMLDISDPLYKETQITVSAGQGTAGQPRTISLPQKELQGSTVRQIMN